MINIRMEYNSEIKSVYHCICYVCMGLIGWKGFLSYYDRRVLLAVVRLA